MTRSLYDSLKTRLVFYTSIVAVSSCMMLFSDLNIAVRPAHADPVYVKGVHIPSFADIVEKVNPAVVSVQVKSDSYEETNAMRHFFGGSGLEQLPDDHPLKRFFQDFEDQQKYSSRGKKKRMRPITQGSGFFISEDGYLVTNNHVTADGTAYTITLDDGTELEAKLVGTDPRTDLAVLKVDSKRKFTYVEFADDNKMRIGDWVVAVGNPFGLGGTVTAGIISARGREIGASLYDDFIQIDAAVNSGNSGGPTFNMNGQVVGINTAIFTPSGGSVGIAFAVPASTAKEVIRQLKDKGFVDRGWLGVQIQPLSKEMADSIGLKEAKGAMVVDPMKGPAFDAGIKAGDVILSVNKEEVVDARALARRIGSMKPGDVVFLEIWRDGKKQNIKITIASMPGQKDGAEKASSSKKAETFLYDYGIALKTADDGNSVIIADVDRDSEAAEQGVRPGDIIRMANNKRVSKVEDITSAIDLAIKSGKTALLLLIESNGTGRFLTVPLQNEK